MKSLPRFFAAARRCNLKQIDSALTSLALDLQNRFEVVEFTDELVSKALEVVRAHRLRGSDAIQLACALIAARTAADPGSFRVVSADDELNHAAISEGLQVENPNLPQ